MKNSLENWQDEEKRTRTAKSIGRLEIAIVDLAQLNGLFHQIQVLERHNAHRKRAAQKEHNQETYNDLASVMLTRFAQQVPCIDQKAQLILHALLRGRRQDKIRFRAWKLPNRLFAFIWI